MALFRPYTIASQRSDRSARDRSRHKHKVKDSIRKNIADLIAEESIIGTNGNKVIKVPIRSIKEHRFIFGDNTPGAGQGDGDAKEGDSVGKSQKKGQGDGQGGNQAGVDAIETEITIEELIEIMFEDLELPDLARKAYKSVLTDDGRKRKGLRKKGIRPRLNKLESAKNRIRRKLTVSKENIPEDGNFPFHQDDLRYFYIAPKEKESSNAVIFCIMDTSGSMGTVKKYLARSFYFLLYHFVKQKYQNVELVFVAHHTEAKEVSEQDFFHKVESGGTYISSGYQKTLEIIANRYHPDHWNIYAFHCSDGDNFYSDNDQAVQAAEELCKICNLFGYGEIKPDGGTYYSGTMLDVFKKITANNFQRVSITSKETLWEAFRDFLSKDKVHAD